MNKHNDSGSNSMAPISSRRLWIKLAVLTLLSGFALLAGRDLVHHIKDLEHWVSLQGWWGALIFVVAVVGLTSIFIPDTLLAALAGALYGVGGGTLIMVAAMICTAAVDYPLSRLLLHKAVNNILSRRPRMAAIHRAVAQEGLRFQLLLRLTPINPVLMNYVLGTSETRFTTYLMACMGLIPTLAVEVYFGHAARHVASAVGGASDHSTLHTVLTLCGLVLCVALLIYITRIARKALTSYETK